MTLLILGVVDTEDNGSGAWWVGGEKQPEIGCSCFGELPCLNASLPVLSDLGWLPSPQMHSNTLSVTVQCPREWFKALHWSEYFYAGYNFF